MDRSWGELPLIPTGHVLQHNLSKRWCWKSRCLFQQQWIPQTAGDDSKWDGHKAWLVEGTLCTMAREQHQGGTLLILAQLQRERKESPASLGLVLQKNNTLAFQRLRILTEQMRERKPRGCFRQQRTEPTAEELEGHHGEPTSLSSIWLGLSFSCLLTHQHLPLPENASSLALSINHKVHHEVI